VTATGTASLLVTDPRWIETNPQLLFLGLNGIEYRSGYLLAGKFVGEIYKVSNLTGVPVVTQVQLDRNVSGAGFDGMVFAPDGTLYVVGGNVGKVWALRSTDNWATATFISEGTSAFPGVTTATLRGSDVYVIHAHFNEVRNIYEIEKITMNPFTVTTGGSSTAATVSSATGAGTSVATGTAGTSAGITTTTGAGPQTTATTTAVAPNSSASSLLPAVILAAIAALLASF